MRETFVTIGPNGQILSEGSLARGRRGEARRAKRAKPAERHARGQVKVPDENPRDFRYPPIPSGVLHMNPSDASRPSIDHGLLSPSGSVSKKSRAAALERARVELFGPAGLASPSCPQEPERAALLRKAAELRDLAARGMSPRKYAKEATRLEALAKGMAANPSDAFGIPEGAHLVPIRGTKMPTPGRQLSRPADVHRYMADAHRSPMERVYAILLDNQTRVLGVVMISQGTLVSSDIHPRETFAPAIAARAAAIILVHNHPSSGAGFPVHPSDADRAVTTRLVAAGAVIGISVMDHVVIGATDFYSLQANEPDIWASAKKLLP